MYTIGQVAEMFQIPVSTLRYYDNEGLFPTMERQSGIRKFSDKELETLHVIEGLRVAAHHRVPEKDRHGDPGHPTVHAMV